jgi:hypothetical protein
MPDIVEYNARWHIIANKGVIRVQDVDGNTTDLEFIDATEFSAVLAVLECEGDAWLGNYKGEKVISSGRVEDRVIEKPVKRIKVLSADEVAEIDAEKKASARHPAAS